MVEKIVNKEQLVSLKNQIDQLVKGAKSPNFQQHEAISESDLSEKEKMVIDCVRKNPGISKEGVVKALKGPTGYSRGPVFKAIENLAEYGMIVVRKDANNRQTQLYINQESLLVSTREQLESVKNNFLDLINKVKLKQSEPEWKASSNPGTLYSILVMYSQLIVTITLSSIFIWPKKTDDREVTQRLYAIGLARIQEIQIKLLEVISQDSRLFRNVLQTLFVLNPDRLTRVYSVLCNCDFNTEAEPVLDSLWQLSFPLNRDLIGDIYKLQWHNDEEREQILKQCEDWRYVCDSYPSR